MIKGEVGRLPNPHLDRRFTEGRTAKRQPGGASRPQIICGNGVSLHQVARVVKFRQAVGFSGNHRDSAIGQRKLVRNSQPVGGSLTGLKALLRLLLQSGEALPKPPSFLGDVLLNGKWPARNV